MLKIDFFVKKYNFSSKKHSMAQNLHIGQKLKFG